MKNRETIEIIVGAVIPSLALPQVVVAGLREAAGELLIVGRTTALSSPHIHSLSDVLQPPATPHPWPEIIGSGHFGGNGARAAITHVEPTVVAEVTADTALQAGKFRHPLRYLRHRPDLEPKDIPQFRSDGIHT